jgi:solute carrier family 25 aspartate/glutamate transporter 12/13
MVSTLREADLSSPHARSRNALKIILDIDENFGRINTGDAKAWKGVPRFMGGK